MKIADSNKRGVVYIVVGEKYTEMAISSAQSMKQHNPDLPIHLFTDQHHTQSRYVDSSSLIDNPHKRSKVDYISESPFEETLYLDADTFILQNIEELYITLSKFDLAIAHAHKRNAKATLQKWNEDIPYAFPQMNSGVILYKKNRATNKLFQKWKSAYHNNNFKKDQVTLRELLWKSNLRFLILPPEYNIRFPKYMEFWSTEEVKPKILHYEEFTMFFNSIQKLKNKSLKK